MSVGSTLAAARQAAGLSISDLSARTRIRPHLILALEADDVAACGGEVYARGHVRALAKAVGIDPEPLLAAMTDPAGAASSSLRAPAADSSLVLRERRAAPGWMTGLALLFGVLVCLAALRLVLPGDRGHAGAPGARQSTPTESPSPAASRSSSPARTSGTGALSVSFAVTGNRCWLAVKDSAGATRLASTLSQGQTATFRDDLKLSVVVGDVKAVTVTVNGRQVDLHGSPGGVKRFVLRANDPLAAFGSSASGSGRSQRSAA